MGKKPALLFAGLLSIFGCNDSSFSSREAAGDAIAQEIDSGNSSGKQSAESNLLDSSLPIVSDSTQLSSAVDLIIALDSSGSMLEERAAIENNLKQLLLAMQKGNLDPRIHFLLGTAPEPSGSFFNFPAEMDSSKIAIVNQRVGSNNALGQVSRLLNGLFTDRYFDVRGGVLPTPFLFRPGAQLEILVITDDDGLNPPGTRDAYSNLAKDFDPGNKWKATVSGIVGLQSSVQAEGVCELARVGQEYITLATRTGGTLLDICSRDWSSLLRHFSLDLLRRSASMLLSKKPLDSTRLLVTLDGKELARDLWTLHAIENRVYLSSSVPFKTGMVLNVSYNIAP